MDSPYRYELDVAFGAVQRAAHLSQHIVASQDKGVVEKDDLSPVTIADYAIQALLTATLQDAFPGDRFVGEEDASALRGNLLLLERVWELLLWAGGEEGSCVGDGGSRHAFTRTSHSPPIAGCKLPESRAHMCNLIDQCGATSPGGPGSGRTWVFDPIDGTKTYMRGELYAINVALLVDGRQTVGVVGCPNLSMDTKGPVRNEDTDGSGEGCIAFAVKDQGAYVRPLQGQYDEARVQRLPSLSTTMAPDDIRSVTCVRYTDSAMDGVHESVAKRLGIPFPGCDLMPWVIRWTALAMGLGNTTFWVYKKKDRYGKAWDHAGAMLLFEETGGKITDVNGRAIDFTAGRKMTGNWGFVAAPAHLHGTVLEAVHAVLENQGKGEYLGNE